jgi:hypothetical protein
MVAQIVLAATILASRRPKIFSNPAKDSGVSFVSIPECPEISSRAPPAYGWSSYGSDKAHALAVLDGTGRAAG